MTAKKKSVKGKQKKNESSKNEEKAISLKEQLALEKDKNLRLFAEFDNFRKRTAKERIELFGTASQDIMTSLLPILDNFERAFKANPPEEGDGILLIYNQLKSELEKKGLKEMDNPIGKELDVAPYHGSLYDDVLGLKTPMSQGDIPEILERLENCDITLILVAP